jgi:NAD dependent epimerase/dehydratase family enzyme
MRIFVTGGTGLVGSLLVKKLRERGDHVVLLTRRPETAKQLGVTVVVGDPVQPGPWMDAVSACDAVVHLAGEGIFNRRWSPEFKDLIYSSRIKSTDNIVAALGKSTVPAGAPSPQDLPPAGQGPPSFLPLPLAGERPAPSSPLPTGGEGPPSFTPPPSGAESPGLRKRVLINGSAVGIYGPHGDEELTEDSLGGNDFLAKVCADWEKAALAATVHGVRVVLLRTGVVLDKNGGALAKMLTPFKLCVGGPIGNGKQWMSWIHNEDEVGLILFALDHPELSGPLNATAPNPVTNREFGKALGKVLGRPSFFPTPGFMLNIMLGESAQIVTTGQHVLPRKALTSGYAFKFREVEAALRDLLAE